MTGSHPFPSSRERGFTLLEMVIVVVLAAMVTLGLVGFYLQSQSMWMEASTQALAQRDATSLVELMRTKGAQAAKALVLPSSPDSLNHLIVFYDNADNEQSRFFWSQADSFVHYGDAVNADQGAVISTIVERFSLNAHPTLPLVHLDTLRVRATSGPQVRMSTSFALYNGTPL